MRRRAAVKATRRYGRVIFPTKFAVRHAEGYPKNVSGVWYTFRYQEKEGHIMNLDEFKAHVEATRQSSKAEAMSVLSATISTTKKEGSK
jgi:hypothetical protein